MQKNFSYTNIIGTKISKTFSTYSVDEEDLIAYYTQKNGQRPALNRTRGGNLKKMTVLNTKSKTHHTKAKMFLDPSGGPVVQRYDTLKYKQFDKTY